MLIANSTTKLQAELDLHRFRGGTRRCVSLITTRGNLHDGHGAVINAAKTVSDIVVVAIMPERPGSVDASKRVNVVTSNEFKDISFIEQHKADMLFAPPEETLDSLGKIHLSYDCLAPEFALPQQLLTQHLKIVNAVQPDIMVWGERNFIEYSQVKRMINDVGLRTQLQCIPTVRHANGAAVSSHDELYTDTQRDQLALIFETLRNAAHAIRAGARNFTKVATTAKLALKGESFKLEYFYILDEDTLAPANSETTTYRIVTKASLDGMPVFDSLGLTL